MVWSLAKTRGSGEVILKLKLENPLGFFESERLVEINDALLEFVGCKWDSPPLLPARWNQSPQLRCVQSHRSRLYLRSRACLG